MNPGSRQQGRRALVVATAAAGTLGVAGALAVGVTAAHAHDAGVKAKTAVKATTTASTPTTTASTPTTTASTPTTTTSTPTASSTPSVTASSSAADTTSSGS